MVVFSGDTQIAKIDKASNPNVKAFGKKVFVSEDQSS
jgi:hypothetical protein